MAWLGFPTSPSPSYYHYLLTHYSILLTDGHGQQLLRSARPGSDAPHFDGQRTGLVGLVVVAYAEQRATWRWGQRQRRWWTPALTACRPRLFEA